MSVANISTGFLGNNYEKNSNEKRAKNPTDLIAGREWDWFWRQRKFDWKYKGRRVCLYLS